MPGKTLVVPGEMTGSEVLGPGTSQRGWSAGRVWGCWTEMPPGLGLHDETCVAGGAGYRDGSPAEAAGWERKRVGPLPCLPLPTVCAEGRTTVAHP